tara:strand:+ start:139213 stop:140085 length:873 start_codon:yes stop_codon:yes gene_type:complete
LDKKTVYIIAGPTASGKSARALELACAHNGVVINADSLQIYQDLPILSAIPDAQEMGDIPHKLYGFLTPEQTCSAQKWRELAEIEIRACFAAGQTPIICGGTGFYIITLTRGLSHIPDVDADIRARFVAQAEAEGAPALHAYLATHDPKAAARLHPNDTQRLIRACEVYAGTGKPISYWQDQPRSGAMDGVKFAVETVMPARDVLHDRCNKRFALMIQNGALDEVAALDARIISGEVAADAAVMRTLGFKELQSYLRGDITLEQATALAQAQTRQYAKRQTTFLRNQPLC